MECSRDHFLDQIGFQRGEKFTQVGVGRRESERSMPEAEEKWKGKMS